MKKVNYTVITSYSIHYTKLYDYIHTSVPDETNSIPDFRDQTLSIWSSGNMIYINGEPGTGASAQLYSIDGRQVEAWDPVSEGALYTNKLPDGVYLFSIKENNRIKTYKIVLSSF